MTQQTVIPHAAMNEQTFGNFFIGDNGDLVVQLKDLVAATRINPTLFIWGGSGAGKTHLLNACCDLAKTQDRAYRYLSLADRLMPERLEETLEERSLVCLDNLHLAQTGSDMEIRLLSIYELVISQQGNFIAAGEVPLNQINLSLADLVSRLSSGGSYRIAPLDEIGKRVALEKRASIRGFALDPPVLDFIMTHFDRDTASLFALLDRIDSDSLSRHRKVTIPFVRELLRAE